MTANTVDLIGGLTNSSNVSKADFTAWAKARVPQVFASNTEINNTLLALQLVVIIKTLGTYYQDTSDTTTADDGLTCIISLDGKRFKPLASSYTANLTVGGSLTVGGVTTSSIRQKLTSNITYAVSKTGNDSNSGQATISAAVTFTNGSSNIGWPAHGRSVGDNFMLSTSGGLPTNFDNATLFYVKTVVDANTIVAALTSGGTAITAGSAGTGIQTATVFSPFLTAARSLAVISNLDFGGCSVVSQLGGGAYAENLALPPYFGRGTTGHTSPMIRGTALNPSAVLIQPASGNAVGATETGDDEWVLRTFKVAAPGALGLNVDVGAWVVCDGMVFGDCINQVQVPGGKLELISPCTWTNGTALNCGIQTSNKGQIIDTGNAHIMAGSPSYGQCFINLNGDTFAQFAAGASWTGTTTGVRWSFDQSSTASSAAGTPFDTLFPGNSNGSYTPIEVRRGGTGSIIGGQFLGTATNDNANAGNIGEFVSATVASASAIALTTATITNIASIALTAGDWDVWINGCFNPANSTSIASAYVSINTTVGGLDQTAGKFGQIPPFVSNGQSFTLNAGPVRISLSTSATIYFNVYAGFTVSTLAAWGTIQARRAR